MSQSTKSANCATEEQVYITTSIPYVNAQPHIGHALEFVQADVLARYHRLCGHDVRFQTGTDENASKNVQAAEAAGVPTQQLVAENADRFQTLADRLHISYDNFIRTSSDDDHRASVAHFWEAAQVTGDIYKKTYSGLYCTGCELFCTEAELNEGRCPVHNASLDLVQEENYFFRLSRYEKQLFELIVSDQLQIVPTTRKNEVLSFISQGLRDFSISRPAERTNGWGIPVPGAPDQVIYVWFDALINYISGLGYANGDANYTRFWSEDNNAVHIIGKDITRFHAIYWPAMLLSAGLPLPRKVLVHGFISSNGQKISKSTGNTVDPEKLLNEAGSDGLRYYLLRHVPTTSDANYTDDAFRQAYNADLADQLGNLVQRSLRLLELYSDGRVPEPEEYTILEKDLINLSQALPDRIHDAFAQDAFHHATAAVWGLTAAVNKYIVETRPWDLAKAATSGDEGAEARLRTCLYTLAEALRIIAHGLLPFLPVTADTIADRLGCPLKPACWEQAFAWGQSIPGVQVAQGDPIFAKII